MDDAHEIAAEQDATRVDLKVVFPKDEIPGSGTRDNACLPPRYSTRPGRRLFRNHSIGTPPLETRVDVTCARKGRDEVLFRGQPRSLWAPADRCLSCAIRAGA